MKREPYSVNTTPSTDPPKDQPADPWLNNDLWGELSDDPFGSSTRSPSTSKAKKTQDPFADFGFDDPFAKRDQPQADLYADQQLDERNKAAKKEERLQAQRRQQVLQRKQAEEYKRRQTEREKQAALRS